MPTENEYTALNIFISFVKKFYDEMNDPIKIVIWPR